MSDRVDPFCRCPDRVSVAGIVTYCPACRRRAFSVGLAVILGLFGLGLAVGLLW